MQQTSGSASAEQVGDGTRPTTVAVLEDEQALSAAIQQSLETVTDIVCVGTAPTLADGLALIDASRPDVLLSDFRLTDGDVTSVLPELRRRSPGTRVLVFTGWPDERSCLDAMGLGASGFLDKATPFEDLVDGIRRIDRGETVVAPRFRAALARRAPGAGGDPTS